MILGGHDIGHGLAEMGMPGGNHQASGAVDVTSGGAAAGGMGIASSAVAGASRLRDWVSK